VFEALENQQRKHAFRDAVEEVAHMVSTMFDIASSESDNTFVIIYTSRFTKQVVCAALACILIAIAQTACAVLIVTLTVMYILLRCACTHELY
jgi:hypothetical protein